MAAIVLPNAPNHDGSDRRDNLCNARRFLHHAVFAEGVAFKAQLRAIRLLGGILNFS
jgi:hypothetical protein